jgi:N-acetylglucosamine-6-phosphate deacetylase
MDFTGLDFKVVIAMATAVPAQAMKIAGSKGSIQTGCDADLAFFDDEFQVAATMINGSTKYQRNKKTGEKECPN